MNYNFISNTDIVLFSKSSHYMDFGTCQAQDSMLAQLLGFPIVDFVFAARGESLACLLKIERCSHNTGGQAEIWTNAVVCY